MSNIHTLSDVNKPVPAESIRNPWGRGAASASGAGVPPGAYGQQMVAAPQQQMMMKDPFWSDNLPPGQPPSFWSMCGVMCCPCAVGPCCSAQRKNDWKRFFMSFMFWVSVVQLIYFIVIMAVGGVQKGNPSLGPSALVLSNLGAKNAPLMRWQGQVFRFLTPALMHAGIWHFLFSLLFQLRFGLGKEAEWGIVKMLLIYWNAAFGGVLMSCLLNPMAISVGASGALFGVLGAFVVEIVYKWRQTPTQQKVALVVSAVIFAFMMIMFGFAWNIDHAAHFGGALVGIFMGCLLLLKGGKVIKAIRFAALGLTIVFYIVGILVFYLAMNIPKP